MIHGYNGNGLAPKSCPALLRPYGLQPARLLCPWDSPGDLPNPGSKPESLTSPALAVGSLPLAPPGKSSRKAAVPKSNGIPNNSNHPQPLTQLVCHF